MKHVEAYVDGGCSPNPGLGAFAAIMVYKGRDKEFVCTDYGTNNEMEMKGALLALRQLTEPCEIHIYTDSQYLYKGMTVWLNKWIGAGWKRGIKNRQLWLQLKTATKGHTVYWHWIRGHDGHKYNERAHNLVQKAMSDARLALGD